MQVTKILRFSVLFWWLIFNGWPHYVYTGSVTVIDGGSGSVSVTVDGSGTITTETTAAAGGQTFTDDFNRSDESLDASANWTETEGTELSIVTNMVQHDANGSAHSARYEQDLDTNDNYTQMVWDAETTGAGDQTLLVVLCRESSSAITAYGFRVTINGSATDTYRLEKIESGSTTGLTTATDEEQSLPITVKVECNGTTIKGFIGGVEKDSVTNGDITTGTRGGFRVFGSDGTEQLRIDDFETGDL